MISYQIIEKPRAEVMAEWQISGNPIEGIQVLNVQLNNTDCMIP